MQNIILCMHQRWTGSGFQDSSPAGFSTFWTIRIGPDYGFIQVSVSGFLNFITWDLTPTQS